MAITKIGRLFYYTIIVFCFFACTDSSDTNKKNKVTEQPIIEPIQQLSAKVITTFPHDVNAFTEGFLFYNNQLFESTGATNDLPQTRSLFGIVNFTDGLIKAKAEINKHKYFGEGIAVINNQFFQLTYKNQICFVYDAKTFKLQKQFTYSNAEGWGLTTDGKELIMSDGSCNLYFINPSNFNITHSITVTNNGYAEDHLNELEYIDGSIYANVWMTNYIIKINPTTGKIISIIDASAIVYQELLNNPTAKELNGIAYNSETKQLLITGKMWRKIYQVEFIEN